MRHSTGSHSRRGKRAIHKKAPRRFRPLLLEVLEDRRLLDAGRLYVDTDAVGAETGESWTDAYVDLQMALDASATRNADGDSANDIAEIWIAEGTYRPTAEFQPGDARSATFSLLDGVTLYGGFAGTEDTLDARDWSTHVTTLSGDLGTLDDNSDNAYTVVYCPSFIEAGLDGVSITGGNADGSYDANDPERGNGGGIYSKRGTLTVTNSTLWGNSASDDGGAIYDDRGMLTVTNSMLSANSASGDGGGIYSYSSTFVLATLMVTNSTLSDNSASGDGGGIYSTGTLTVTSTTLSGNSASGDGGGIYNYYGTLTVTNSALSGNSATGSGGGIYNNTIHSLTLTNSTLSGNFASGSGGGIHNFSSTLTVANSIVCWNSGHNIEGLFAIDGSSNLIGIDPGFVRAPSAGPDGDWGTADDDLGDLRLADRSPAINGGSNLLAVDAAGNALTTDLDGNPRIADGTVDIGAYEYQGPPAPGRETPSLVVSARDDQFDLYDGDITLREAIHYSLSGIGSTVTFDASLDGATITLAGAELLGNHAIVIDASALSSLTLNGDNRSRVFRITDDVTLSGLTITGGSDGGIYSSGTLTVTNSTLSGNSASGNGGGIYMGNGTLMVTNSTLSGNSADSDGGGIYNHGTSTVTNSTLSGNSVNGNGGGILNTGTLTLANSTLSGNSTGFSGIGGGISNTGTLTVANSTLSGNSAGFDGGGICNGGWGSGARTLTVTNSTFFGNSTGSFGSLATGGGICNYGTLTVTNSTFSGNSASSGGGISSFGSSSTATLNNTIVAGNGGKDVLLHSGTLSGSHNLIGDGSGQSTFVNGVDGNHVGTSSSPIDPLLSDWTQFDNGQRGYHLLPGSPAINVGSNDLLPVDTFDLDNDGSTSEPWPIDLAGNARVFGGTVDIGACEFLPPDQFAVMWHLPKSQLLPGIAEVRLFFNPILSTP